MSFYIQISEEEMSEEITFGDDAYGATIADGPLTDEARARSTSVERNWRRPKNCE
eukprot:COSAG06_NODE_67458_length_252_cov_0.490196_1_plen_54_part_01